MNLKETAYGAFVDYYGDIQMKKIKVEIGWVIYGAKVNSGLSINRYIFVVVPENYDRGDVANLESLDWVSLQTRTTLEAYDVPNYSFFLDEKRKKMLSDIINVIDRTEDRTNYITTELPIKISLLHDKKKNNHLQYPDKAYLYQALETYNCVVEML